MSEQMNAEESGYALKRQGRFDAALQWYVCEYARSFEKGFLYPQELCFEQIMDIISIKYLQEGKQFRDTNHLMDTLAADIRELLAGVNAFRSEEVEKFLASGRFLLLSRGRRRAGFTVDRSRLIAKKAPKAERKAG